MTDDEQTTDDQIRSELASSSTVTDGGDPTGSDVQAGINAPGGLPDYLSFLRGQSGGGVLSALKGAAGAIAPGQPGAQPVNIDGTAAPQPQLKSVSGSYKGSTEHGKKFAGGLFGEADRRTAEYSDQDLARTQGEIADSNAGYRNLQEQTSKEVGINDEFARKQDELMQRESDFYQHQANLEARAADQAKAERAKFLSAYQEQLSAVKALTLQSGNPLSQMSGGQALGLAGAEFAQGFLAARGINIDVSGQVDRWVDRSIKEHQMRIENARGAAEDQLHLYEIARQNSQDDWEARQRYRGFVIQGMQTSIQQNAMRWQSDIASAHANEAVAKLGIEANQTARQIGDAHENRVLQRYTAEIHRASAQGQLAIEQQKLAIEAEKQKAAQNAKQAAAFYVADPEKRVVVGADGQKHVVQVRTKMVNPLLGKEQQEYLAKKASDASDAEGDYQDKLTRLIEARKGVENEWGLAARAGRKVGKEDEAWQEYQNAKNDFVNTVIYKRSGKQINDSEFQRFFGMVPDQKLLQSGSSAKLLNDMQEVGRKEYQRLTDDPNYIDVPDTLDVKDPKTGKTVTVRNPDKYHEVSDVEPGLAALHRAQKSADAGGAPTPDSVSDDLQNADQPTGKLTNATPGWEKLMGAGGKNMPLEATFVDDLVRAAIHPQHYRQSGFANHTLPDDDATIQSDGLQALEGLAQEPTQTGTYARQWLSYIQSQPEKARELVLGPADPENLKSDVPRGVPRSFRK